MPTTDEGRRTIDKLISLRGRAAVVTGGARGIGLGISARLAEAGAGVLIGDIDADAARAGAAVLADRGGTAIGTHLDVASSDSIEAVADHAVEHLGTIDIWVNNAGIYPCSPVLETSDADWDAVLDVDLRGVFAGARAAARRMIDADRGGVIINIASTAAYRVGGVGVAHYVAAKHGVLGLTKSLAVELGPHGIRVLAIAPTVTSTPGLDEARRSFAAGGFELEELGRRLPLGRTGTPDDVARATLFCASDLSSLMTGSALLVDAGETAI